MTTLNCDSCNKSIDHHLCYHIGLRAEEIELGYTPYFCQPCFLLEASRLVRLAEHNRPVWSIINSTTGGSYGK